MSKEPKKTINGNTERQRQIRVSYPNEEIIKTLGELLDSNDLLSEYVERLVEDGLYRKIRNNSSPETLIIRTALSLGLDQLRTFFSPDTPSALMPDVTCSTERANSHDLLRTILDEAIFAQMNTSYDMDGAYERTLLEIRAIILHSDRDPTYTIGVIAKLISLLRLTQALSYDTPQLSYLRENINNLSEEDRYRLIQSLINNS